MNTVKAVNGFSDVRGVVAVDNHVPSAGAIVWWRLSGRVDFDTLEAAWVAAGLNPEELPSSCSPTVALRRAAGELREKHRLVRPLGRDAGFAVVRESIDDGHEPDYDVICKVTLDEVGRAKVTKVSGSDSVVNNINIEVQAAYERSLGSLETEDFSHWLVKLMPKLDAVGLRYGGGIYFVPPFAMAKLEGAVLVLRSVTEHVINRVPAMKSEDAVDAILDAVAQEAEVEAAAMEKDLEEAKLGKRGYENRIQSCDEMEGKVARYEELLGRSLETMRERLETLRANLTVAVLKADSDKETA